MSTTVTGQIAPATLEQVSAADPGLNYWWLRRMCSTRQIEFTKVGKSYCLTPAQVEAAKLRRYVTVGTAASDDIARERERRAQRPTRRRASKAA